MTARVLLVDDDPVLLSMMVSAFKAAGYITAQAENGRKALAVFDEHEPDLVVTDIVMPEMEGIGLILELKRKETPPRIIAISEAGRLRTYDYLKWASHLGADDVLSKPIRMADLLARARRLVPVHSTSTTTARKVGG